MEIEMKNELGRRRSQRSPKNVSSGSGSTLLQQHYSNAAVAGDGASRSLPNGLLVTELRSQFQAVAKKKTINLCSQSTITHCNTIFEWKILVQAYSQFHRDTDKSHNDAGSSLANPCTPRCGSQLRMPLIQPSPSRSSLTLRLQCKQSLKGIFSGVFCFAIWDSTP